MEKRISVFIGRTIFPLVKNYRISILTGFQCVYGINKLLLLARLHDFYHAIFYNSCIKVVRARQACSNLSSRLATETGET